MLSTLDSPTRRLYILLLVGCMIFGIVMTIAGASLPSIIRSFNWSYLVTGFVLSASALGYFISTFVCGFLVQKFQPKLVLVIGLCLGAASMLFFARTPLPLLNFLLFFLVGLCQGTIEIVSNLEVIHMEQKGQSRLMNLLHAAFSVGAIVGPAFVGALVWLHLGWIIVFPVTAGLLAVMGALFGITRFPRTAEQKETGAPSGVTLLRQPLLLLFTLMLLLYVGSELGVSNWVSEYFVKVLSAPVSMGAFSVSLFWGGLFTGRLSISLIYHGARQERLLLVLTLLSTAALALALVFSSLALAAIFIFLAGLGYSSVYPMIMSLVGKSYRSGVAVGIAATGGGIGSFTFPFLIAVFFDVFGLRGGFWIYVAINVLLTGLSGFVILMIRSKSSPEGDHAQSSPC
jgi:fucose permease